MIVVTIKDIVFLSFFGIWLLLMVLLLIYKTVTDYIENKKYKKDRLEYLRKNPMLVTDDDLKVFNKKELPR